MTESARNSRNDARNDAEHVVAVAVDHAVFHASFRTFSADEVDDEDWLTIARHMHYVEDVIDASVYRWRPEIDGPGAGG